MFRFMSIGSGSSGNCYYLSTGNTQILVDAGIPVRTIKHTMRESGLSLEEIKGVFVTHDHADHIKSVGNIANDLHIPIFATEAVHRGINRNYCVTHKLQNTDVRVIQKGIALQFGDFLITPFDVPHDSTDCVGYRIEAEGIIFCIITDVGKATDIIQEQVSQAKYLVLESNYDDDMLAMGPYPAYLKGRIRSGSGHLSNALSARLVAEHASPDLKHLWLCHLSQENNHPELARKTFESILREYGIVAGVDFRFDVLRRRTASALYELDM